MQKSFILLGATLLILGGCQSSTPVDQPGSSSATSMTTSSSDMSIASSDVSQLASYTNTQGGYSLQYPKTWAMQENMPLFDFFGTAKGALFTPDSFLYSHPQLQIISSADCPAIPQGAKNAAGVTIGNLPFSAYTWGDGAAGTLTEAKTYRYNTVGRCTVITELIRYSNPGAYDDFATRGPALELEKTRAYAAFDAVLKTFAAM